MSAPERARLRRCLGLRVAVVFGIVLAILYRDYWPTVAVAVAGIGVALVTYWRNCRGGARARS